MHSGHRADAPSMLAQCPPLIYNAQAGRENRGAHGNNPDQMDARIEPGQVKSLTHNEARAIVIGMLLPVFMGSLDNTILASALPTIGREFGNVHDLPWLISIYLLASTAVVPLYGKLSDIYGRQFTLRIALALYMLGSLVCALAPSMLALILGRALH